MAASCGHTHSQRTLYRIWLHIAQVGVTKPKYFVVSQLWKVSLSENQTGIVSCDDRPRCYLPNNT